MANIDSPFGLRATRMISGAPYSGGESSYRIANNYDTAIFSGDLVVAVTGGGIEKYDLSAATVPILGVFVGCKYTDPVDQSQRFSSYYPASTAADDIEALVIDGSDVVFTVQADAAFPVADLFGNFQVTAGAGNTRTGTSGIELSVTSGADTATLPLKAIDISRDPDNSDVASTHTNVLVVIQNHVFGQKAAGLAQEN